MTSKRWKNSVLNVESDTGANIDSDHYPVTATIKIKLKAVQGAHRTRTKYDICNETQWEEYNAEIAVFAYERNEKQFTEHIRQTI